LDTDGHLHHNFYEILTKFEPLKQDILFLARSLGFAAYFSEKYVETQKGLQKYYRITISGNVNEIPCIVPRKKASPRGQIKDVLNVGFEVQPLGIGEYFGFELEGPDRLFLLGDFTVTHNSTLANQIAINAHLGGLTPHEVFVKGIVPTQCYSVNYNTFEMGKEECLLRNQPNLTRIPSNRFQLQSLTPAERKKSDQIFARFLAHGEKFGKRLEYNCPSRDINISQLITAIEPMSFDIVVVDYINLMSYINPKESMWWNIGEAFRLMKRFAERTRSAVIMVVQIDEETKNIKYAKSIRHHSDGVWLWDWNDAIKEAGGLVEVDQNKLRNFAPCKFNLQAEFEYCAFSESFGSGADPTGSPAPSSLKPMTL